MANVIVTSTTNSIRVDFGVFAMGTLSKATFKRESVENVQLHDDHVQVTISGGDSFDVAHTSTSGTMTIDSINSVAPTSLEDLYNKICALIA